MSPTGIASSLGEWAFVALEGRRCPYRIELPNQRRLASTIPKIADQVSWLLMVAWL